MNGAKSGIHFVFAAAAVLSLNGTAAWALVADLSAWVTNGNVNTMVLSGNSLYIGGDFTSVGPNTGGGASLDSESGVLSSGCPRVEGTLSCVVSDGAGGWYIGGSFTSVGGVARANLAHLRPDLTLDSWSPAPDQEVRALAVSGTVVYAGGTFTNIGGQPRNHIAALDATTGQATPWNPDAGVGSESLVQAIVISGSTVYVGGNFANIGGEPRLSIAALDASTGLATAWNPGVGAVPSGERYVMSIAVNGATIYAGGLFSSIGGQPRKNIGAVDAVTGLATGWNPSADLVLQGVTLLPAVWTMALRGSIVYVGGRFSNIGGQPRSHIAALDATTGQATGWNPWVYGGDSGDGVGEVRALSLSDSKVYVGGRFDAVGFVDDLNGIAAIDIATGQSSAWNPDAGVGRRVLALVVSGSRVYAGGDFMSIGRLPRKGLAALDATTGQPTAWNPGAVGGVVQTLAVRNATVYVGGFFTTVAGQARNNLAAIDATTGQVIGWNPNVSGGDVTTVAVHGGTVYVGGLFTEIAGQPRSWLAALDAISGEPTSWNPGVFGELQFSGVRAIAVTDSAVYVGGCFTTIAGQSRSNIAALDPITGQALPWDPNVEYGDYGVLAMVVNSPVIYLGGDFSSVGGQTRVLLAAVDLITGQATAWQSGYAPGPPYPLPPLRSFMGALAISASGVYVGGNVGQIALLDAGTGAHIGTTPRGSGSSVACLAVRGQSLIVGTVGLPGSITWFNPPDTSPPAVEVLSPNGGSPLLIGSQRQLSWSATDELSVQSVDIYLSRTGPAGPWQLLAAAAPNTGSYLWAVTGPEVFANNAYLLVVARDYTGNLGADVSNSGFSISNSAVDVGTSGTVTAFALSSPAPNPTRGRSVLTFAVPSRTHVRLSLFDVQGRERMLIVDRWYEAGRYAAVVEAPNLSGGVYFAHMQAGGKLLTKRMTVVK